MAKKIDKHLVDGDEVHFFRDEEVPGKDKALVEFSTKKCRYKVDCDECWLVTPLNYYPMKEALRNSLIEKRKVKKITLRERVWWAWLSLRHPEVIKDLRDRSCGVEEEE